MIESAARTIVKGVRHPGRALLRLLLSARLRRHDLATAQKEFQAWLSVQYGVDAAALRAHYACSAFAQWYARRRAELKAIRGPVRMGTSGAFALELLYLLVRAARPRAVVETGVLYGGSSAHILAALEDNGEGKLYSIELGRDSREPPHDFLVPEELKRRWELRLGDSRRELPRLLAHLPDVDLFHHDSLHTFEHMTWEFETVLPYLTHGSVLLSHDVLVAHSLREIFGTNAFLVFCRHHHLAYRTFQNTGCALVVDAPVRRSSVGILRR